MKILPIVVLALSAPLFLSACASYGEGRDRIVTFSPQYPMNYLVLHERLDPQVIQSSTCYELEAEDNGSRVHIGLLLRELLAERLPMLPRCRGGEARKLFIEYHAGYGVHVDMFEPPTAPRSGFAFFSVYTRAGEHLGGGEWDYWRGGSAELLAEQFVFDFTNLYINGLVKPPPGTR